MKTLKADLSLFGITIFWGASFPIMSRVLKLIPTFSYVSLRYMLAAVILSLIFHRSFRNINKQTIIGAVLIGGSLFVGSVLQVAGLNYTTPSKSGFITGLNAVFVPLMVIILYKKLPDKRTILGVILSVLGLLFMSGGGINGFNFGDFLTLLCAIVFSAQVLFVDKYTKGVDVLLLTCLELFVVGFLSLIPAVGVEGLNIKVTGFSIFAVLFSAFLCTALAMIVQNKMQPLTEPSHAAIIYLAEPVFGAIFSAMAGDRMNLNTLIGCVLIFLGMLVLNIKIGKKDDKELGEQAV